MTIPNIELARCAITRTLQSISMQNINLDKVVVLITAGGRGLRLWPLSTMKKPKQFCRLISEKTMLQLTLERVTNLVPIERIFVVTCAEQVNFVKELPSLQEENIIVEPEGRDSAPAIGYAAVWIENKIPNATMVVLAADQIINPIELFQESIFKSIEIAQNGNYFVSVGIAPTEPNFEYGYMECGSQMEFSPLAHYGLRYVEKPDLETAKNFLKAGNYLWNTNIFVWQISHLLNAFKIYQPDAYKIFRKIQACLGSISSQELALNYSKLERISIDFAILEKINRDYQHSFVIGKFDWSDIGNFSELAKTMKMDSFGNRCKGSVKKNQTENCILIAESPYKLDVKGVSNLTIVVNERGDILVSLNTSARKIKDVLRVPINTNIQKYQGKFVVNNNSGTGNVLNGMARLLNAQNIVFDADKSNILCALDIENICVKTKGKTIFVTPKNELFYKVSSEDINMPVEFGSTKQNMEFTEDFKILIEEDYEQMSENAAASLVEELNKVLSIKNKAVAVFSAGTTPKKTYELLRTKYRNQVDWQKIIIFQMDDYLGLSSRHHQSFSHYLLKELILPLGIQKYYFLNDESGKEVIKLADYETKIEQEGGIDIIVHGIGINGHLGFNEPGSSFKSKVRIVDLAESTIQANSKMFNSVSEVPKKAVTMGMEIMSKAKTTFLLASGKNKQFAVKSSIFEPISENMPASILQTYPQVKIILDREACSWI